MHRLVVSSRRKKYKQATKLAEKPDWKIVIFTYLAYEEKNDGKDTFSTACD